MSFAKIPISSVQHTNNAMHRCTDAAQVSETKGHSPQFAAMNTSTIVVLAANNTRFGEYKTILQ
jgi:hypothetical protein